MNRSNSKIKTYVGTYTTGEGKGIYSFELDLSNGMLDNVKLEAEMGNPTYLCIDRENKYLYSAIKTGNSGGVAAFSITPDTSELVNLNYSVSDENSPCHVSINNDADLLFSANYHQGLCKVHRISEDGSVLPEVSVTAHCGCGPNKERQEKAHIHFSSLTPDEKYLCVIDLGLDQMVTYTVNNGMLSRYKEFKLKPGSGPRHMDFHPNGKYAYIVTELSSEVAVFDYSSETGDFKELQYISALPLDYKGENLGSAIHISPDGRYLYASNRGHDSIAIFSIDSNSGKVSTVAYTSTEGNHPRDFNLDPTGSYLIAANKDTNNIVCFSVDKATGKLSKKLSEIFIPNPVCIKFINI